MSFLDPRAWLIAIAILATSCMGAYLKGRADGRAIEKAEQSQEAENWRMNAEAAAELYEAEKAKKAPQIRTIYKTKEVVRNANPDFAKCRAGDDGLRVLNDRIDLANSREPSPAVPSAGQTGK